MANNFIDEVSVPLYYVCSRGIPTEEAQIVIQALAITPVACVLISDVMDTELAILLGGEVIRTDSDASAAVLASHISEELNQPVLVIGEADFLTAIYSDGTKEAVVHTC